MALPECVIRDVVRRGDFDGAGAKGWIHEVGIRYNGDREVGDERMADEFVVEIL